MANYYVKGYTPPAGIKSTEDVKRKQKELGVKVDGIWGPNTQAAYDKQSSSFKQYGTRGKKTYSPPKGIDSVSEIKDAQRRLGVTVDGIWGEKTEAAWTNMRNSGNKSINLTFTTSNDNAKQDNNDSFSKPKYSAPKGIDSVEEIKQTQRHLCVTVDGVWGSETQNAWNAMRSGGKQSIFTAPKGINTEKEIKQTQQRLGVSESGIWDRSTNDAWESMRSGGKISESKYTAKGFTAPEGVDSPTDVRNIQKVLGVKQSGIWDMTTQSAWNKQFGDLWTNNQSSKRNPPAEIDSPEEIKQVQARLGVTEDGIWGAETQAAWDRMRDGGTKQASIHTILNKDNQIGIQHHEKNPSLKDGITSVIEDSWQIDKSLEFEIESSKLKAAEKERAIKFISELDDNEKKLLLDLIDEKGSSKTLSYNKLFETAEEIIKTKKNVDFIDAQSPLNKEESLLRPRVYPETAVSGVSFSEYYYKDGKYYFNIKYNDAREERVCVGKNLPSETHLTIGELGNWDVIMREAEKYAGIVVEGLPQIAVENIIKQAASNGNPYSQINSIDMSPMFELPAWEQMIDYAKELFSQNDKVSFTDTQTGDIVISVFTKYPPGFLSQSKGYEVIYIKR